ncbi:MAG: SPOR domain-containing protein [Acidobacteria bacterium]|nr:SPOR domain-containing protein [Acidobacteriota bacterium]MBI3662437.1 SPOR domain-containing protein [Acidobacteriota bacterium]
MANGSMKKPGGGRETVLESRHVVGMFLGVVVLCGVFFTLGYVMGRTQQDSSVRAVSASTADRGAAGPANKTAAPAPAPSSWDFIGGADSKKSSGKLETPANPAAASGQPAPAGGPPPVITSTPIKTETPPVKTPEKAAAKSAPAPARNAMMKSPVIPRGHVVLQIAALTREGDALALVEALQKKQFPAFVLTPATGNLYRVQVGPYPDGKAADAAKKALEREGFKAITKR